MPGIKSLFILSLLPLLNFPGLPSYAAETGSTPVASTQVFKSSSTARVGEQGAKIYSSNRETMPPIGELPPGSPVQLVRRQGDWVYVQVPGGLEVWVYGRYIDGDSGQGTVNADNVRARPLPSTASNSSPVGTFNSGESVEVLEVRGEWKRVHAPERLGAWVKAKDVARAEKTGMSSISKADLKSVLDLALKNDPVFGADKATYKAELESVPQARSGLLPQVSASADAARIDEEFSNSNPDSILLQSASFNNTRVNLALTQTIFDKSLIVAYQQSKDQAALAKLILSIARQDLIFRVAQRYFSVLGGQDNLDLAQSEKKAIGRQLELAQERLKVGLGTTTDLYDAQARFKLAEVSEIDAINFLEDAKQSLVELIGEYPGELKILNLDTELKPPTPNNLKAWVQSALRNNLSIAVQRQTADLSSKEIERQRSGHYPIVDFTLSHADRDSSGGLAGFSSDSKSTEARFQLSIPIYQGGLVTSRTTEASFRHEASLKDLDSQLRFVDRDTRSTFLNISSGTSRVSALNQAVIASKSAVEAKQEGFAAGLNTNIDVLDAQSDLFTASRDYLLARYTYILDSLRLEALVGTLDDEDLVYINGWLQ